MASGSKSSTSTSSSQSTNVSELNLQDTGGITVADNKGSTALNYTNVSTDSGAISGNVAVARAGLTTAERLSSDVNSAAVTLGQTALDTGAGLANKGLDNAAAAYQSGLTFGTDALDTVAQIQQDSLAHFEALTSNALAGYQSIAQQNSATDSTQIQKVALYALLAAVAVVVLPAMFKAS